MDIKIKVNFDIRKLDVWEINKIGLFNASEKLIKQAQELAPYETGTLKKSIARDPQNITKTTKQVAIGPRDVVYAVRREFENYKNPDRKFYMKKTWEKWDSIVKTEFEKAVAIVIKSL